MNVATDAAGSQIELVEYKPFGEFFRHDQSGTSNAAWAYFTGKQQDDETGLIYFGARYYSPLIGRFLTPDTIVQSPMNPQTLNRYSYCGNNPVNFTDPDGHSWKSFFKGVGEFFSNFVKHPVQTILAAATFIFAVVVPTPASPWMIASASLSLFNTGTSSFTGGAWDTVHDFVGYAAIATAVVATGIQIHTAWQNAHPPAQTADVLQGVSNDPLYKSGDLIRAFERMHTDNLMQAFAQGNDMNWANNANNFLLDMQGIADSFSPIDLLTIGKSAATSVVRSGLNAGRNAVFYTGGGKATEQAALAYAREIGGRTILNTPIGKALDVVKAPDALWRASSRVFANSARGNAHVIIGEGASWSRTFGSIEAEILERNGIEIMFHLR